MSIAASVFAVGLLASHAVSAVNPSIPPIVVSVSTTNIPPSVVDLTLAEVDAIFRSAGMTFLWRRNGEALARVRVVFGHERGPERDETLTPLGWIRFDHGRPGDEINVSYSNAERYLNQARPVLGTLAGMTRFEHDILMSRIMGRALAHEFGHYLLASAAHATKGLMLGKRTPAELLSSDRGRFQLELAARQQIAARLVGQPAVASR